LDGTNGAIRMFSRYAKGVRGRYASPIRFVFRKACRPRTPSALRLNITFSQVLDKFVQILPSRWFAGNSPAYNNHRRENKGSSLTPINT
jgi:hypothetical protein